MKNSIALLALTGLLISCQPKRSDGTPSPFEPVATPPATNPGNGSTQDPTPTPTPTSTPTPVASMKINSGDKATKSSTVTLTMDSANASLMKISEDDKCSSTTWVRFQSPYSYKMTAANKLVTLSAQFRAADGGISSCVTASIRHDDLAPELTLQDDLSNTKELGSSHKLSFHALDMGVGVKSIDCLLNNSPVGCKIDTAGAGALDFNEYLLGKNTFTLNAVDQLGTQGSKSIEWTVTKATRKVEQTLTLVDQNKIDILMMIDNSPSMRDILQNIPKMMGTFIKQLGNLDWQLSLITADSYDTAKGDGRFLEFAGTKGVYVLNSKYPTAQAQEILSKTLQQDYTNAREQGVLAFYRALERSLDKNSVNSKLIRPDAVLAGVVISDGDETATIPKAIPQNLIKFVQSSISTRNFVFHSTVVQPNDWKCLTQRMSRFGHKFAELSKLTTTNTIGGAVMPSICDSSYSDFYTNFASTIQPFRLSLQLECVPVSEIEIRLDGMAYKEEYQRDLTKLTFKKSLPSGKYELRYSCSQ